MVNSCFGFKRKLIKYNAVGKSRSSMLRSGAERVGEWVARGSRGFQSTAAASAKSKGKKDTDKRKAKQPGQLSLQACTGLNIYKEGSDPQLDHPDSYPDWLWSLLEPEPSLSRLERRAQEYGLKNLDRYTLNRLYDLFNRRKIKEQNTRAAGRS
jgi:hypothetical protein